METALIKPALPAAFSFFLQRIEPFGDIVGCGSTFFCVTSDTRIENTGYCRLFDHLAIVAAVQIAQDAADRARFLSKHAQVDASPLLAGSEPKHCILETSCNQIILESALVFQILLGFCTRDFVKRWLCNKDMAAFDQFFHLPEEKRQEQRADVRAIYVRIGHDDDLVVRSEEHTSELQSLRHLVCRLL